MCYDFTACLPGAHTHTYASRVTHADSLQARICLLAHAAHTGTTAAWRAMAQPVSQSGLSLSLTLTLMFEGIFQCSRLYLFLSLFPLQSPSLTVFPRHTLRHSEQGASVVQQGKRKRICKWQQWHRHTHCLCGCGDSFSSPDFYFLYFLLAFPVLVLHLLHRLSHDVRTQSLHHSMEQEKKAKDHTNIHRERSECSVSVSVSEPGAHLVSLSCLLPLALLCITNCSRRRCSAFSFSAQIPVSWPPLTQKERERERQGRAESKRGSIERENGEEEEGNARLYCEIRICVSPHSFSVCLCVYVFAIEWRESSC